MNDEYLTALLTFDGPDIARLKQTGGSMTSANTSNIAPTELGLSAVKKMIDAMRQYDAAEKDACREHMHAFMKANKVSPETHLMLIHPTDIDRYWHALLPEFVRLHPFIQRGVIIFVRRSPLDLTGGPPL